MHLRLTSFAKFVRLAAVAGTGLAALLCARGQSGTPVATLPRLTRLMVADTDAKVTALNPGPEFGNVIVQDVPVLATKEFAQFVTPYLGQPITVEMVTRLGNDIAAFVKKRDRPVVNIGVPKQDASGGEVRFTVMIGRYNELQFRGNRWFSRKLLESKLGIKPGDEIRLSLLEEAVNWANTNPFRQVQVLLNNLPAGTDATGATGATDLIVGVQERLPLRLAASYDDSGVNLLGKDHYTASLQYGNVWGLDHQLSYQFTTGDHQHVFKAHSADYRVPLPWHHYLQAAASYALVQPSFAGGLFNLKGESKVASLRYLAPANRGSWICEFSAGLDFKQSNNNLEYGGTQLPGTTNDVWQATLGATLVRRDPWGTWAIGSSLSLSPGDFTTRNSDASFGSSRYGATARYAVASLQVQRVTKMPGKLQLFSRGQLQLASTNLLGSEQLSIGGQATVRGYDERIFSGDRGGVVSNELQGPEWKKPLAFLPKRFPPLNTRLLVFWDYARVFYKHPIGTDIRLDPLMSAGLGLRSNLLNLFTVSADYGWQLLDTTRPQPQHGRGHIKVTLAY